MDLRGSGARMSSSLWRPVAACATLCRPVAADWIPYKKHFRRTGGRGWWMGGGDWKDWGLGGDWKDWGLKDVSHARRSRRSADSGRFLAPLQPWFFQRLRYGQGAQPRHIQKYENNMKKIWPGIWQKYDFWGPDLGPEPKNVIKIWKWCE